MDTSPYPTPTEATFPAPVPTSRAFSSDVSDMDTDEALTKAADGLITMFNFTKAGRRWSLASSSDHSVGTSSSSSGVTLAPDSHSDDLWSRHSYRTASPPAERLTASERLQVARSQSLPILTTDSLLDEWKLFDLEKLKVDLIVFPTAVTLPVLGAASCLSEAAASIASAKPEVGGAPPSDVRPAEWKDFMDQVFSGYL